jgi:cyanophycinase
MNGTIALVGSGEYLSGMEPVDRYLLERLPSAPKVVCLPTAAGTEGPERIHYWSELGVGHFTHLGAQVDAVEVIDRETAEDAGMAERVASANFVYLSGGHPDYLHRVLDGSRTWSAIQAVLEGGGVVAGCSAGAMIFGEKIPGFRNPWSLQDAFGFLPGVVVLPHFDEMPASFVRLARFALPARYTIVGVEGYTALALQDGQARVIGGGGVTIWNGNGKTRFTQGQAVPLG